jgi:hypothetical protein
MGLETAAIVMAGIAVGAEFFKADNQIKSADSQEKALDLQAKETQLQTQQKTLQNYSVMEKVLDAQAAHMTTTGTAFSSPSYNAIQRNTLNIGAKTQRNTDIEGGLQEENISIEKNNVQNKLYAELFGDVAETAMGAFNIASKVPSKNSTASTRT